MDLLGTMSGRLDGALDRTVNLKGSQCSIGGRVTGSERPLLDISGIARTRETMVSRYRYESGRGVVENESGTKKDSARRS